MAVTDEQVAAVRALLTGDITENRRLLAGLDSGPGRVGYSALVNAAFFEAVDRRFGKGSTPADVIDYVADVRSRSADLAEKLDPRVGERLIGEVLGSESTDDIDSQASATATVFLAAALVADENFGRAELDQFLATVRKLAEHLLRDE